MLIFQMPEWKRFSVFLCFHKLRLLYRLMDFETESFVETFQQTTIEVHEDKTCRVKVCVTKKTQKHLPVWHDVVCSVSPYFILSFTSYQSTRLLRKEEPESVKAFSEEFLTSNM
jgi:hypothetical protein